VISQSWLRSRLTTPPPPPDEDFEEFLDMEGNEDLEHISGVPVSNGFPLERAKNLQVVQGTVTAAGGC
jgi:hypothetical protein